MRFKPGDRVILDECVGIVSRSLKSDSYDDDVLVLFPETYYPTWVKASVLSFAPTSWGAAPDVCDCGGDSIRSPHYKWCARYKT